MLSLVSKGSAYDYYWTLEKITNNAGVDLPPPRYRAMSCMLSQWRHLKMKLRGGQGHVDKGILTTGVGELAIKCPSCPHPDINLDEDWRTRPSSDW